MTLPASNTGRRIGVLVMVAGCVLALADCGHAGNPLAGATSRIGKEQDPAQRCRDAVVDAIGGVARRIYAEAQGGPNAMSYARTLERSAPLIAAVGAGDAPATQAALMPLLARQLVHVRVARGSRVLADLGKPNAIAPARGVLRDTTGRALGAYAIAVQDDRAYVEVFHGITSADVVLRSGGRQIAETLPLRNVAIPARERVRYGGRVYEAMSFGGTVFPSGPLQISILVDRGQIGNCRDGPAAAVAETLGAAGMRIYEGEVSSGKVSLTIRRMETSTRFRRAVLHSDRAATLSAIKGFFRLHQFHIVRARVMRHGRLLADLGGPYVLGPARAVLFANPQGRPTASFLVAVQDDAGYMKLARLFTGAEVVMRVGGRVVMSTLSAPPTESLPARGAVVVGRRSYRVFTFSGTAFPTGAVNISLLFAS